MKKEYDFSKGRRGAVVAPHPGKTRITIRLDDDVLTWFRQAVNESGGGNYQTLINNALRDYIGQRPEPLENGDSAGAQGRTQANCLMIREYHPI